MGNQINHRDLRSDFDFTQNYNNIVIPRKREQKTQYDSSMDMNAYLHYKLLDTNLDNELNQKNQTILKSN